MSADNWTTCPRCEVDENNRIKKLKLDAGKAYGKVSSEEYLKLLEESSKPAKHEDTLREDYEIGTHEGKFYAIYSCSCNVCHFSHKFRHEEQLKI